MELSLKFCLCQCWQASHSAVVPSWFIHPRKVDIARSVLVCAIIESQMLTHMQPLKCLCQFFEVLIRRCVFINHENTLRVVALSLRAPFFGPLQCLPPYIMGKYAKRCFNLDQILYYLSVNSVTNKCNVGDEIERNLYHLDPLASSGSVDSSRIDFLS